MTGRLAGAGVGALAAVIVDAALLSWEPAAVPEPAPPTARGLTVSPSVVWTREHTGLGLHGTF